MRLSVTRTVLLLCATVLLGGCVGSMHALPEITPDALAEYREFLEEEQKNAVLKPIYRPIEDERAMVYRVTNRLLEHVHAMCLQTEYETCFMNVQYAPDAAEFNAYADHRDIITVNAGLVRYMESDDQLAAVVAHEMAHVMTQHVKKSMQNQQVGAIAMALLLGGLSSAGGGQPRPSDIQNYGQVGANIGGIAFSKEMEREADYLSAYLLARSGYDLEEAKDIWVSFSVARGEGSLKTAMFGTHPGSPERLAQWDATIKEIADDDDMLPVLKAKTGQ